MLAAISTRAVAHASPPLASASSAVSDWFEAHGSDILTAAAILIAAVIINFLVRRSIRLAVDRLVKTSEAQRAKAEREDTGSLPQQTAERVAAAALQRERSEQRTRTIGSLLRYVATIAIYTIATLMALSELGIDTAALLASAGIAGIALGFGAQSLVKDFISGLFMLMEDQFGVGDVVDLGEASGTVEHVTLRVTTVRGTDGTVWYVPNGQVVRVGNQSQRWSRTLLDIEVAYDTDLDRASEVIKRVADEFWKEQAAGATVIEEPELWGVQNVSPTAVVLRLAVKTRPGEQWAAGRALRARLKTAFDEAGIATPQPVPGMWLTGGPSGGASGPSGGSPTGQGGPRA
jgi:moderate conductance mechanosensitive channel